LRADAASLSQLPKAPPDASDPRAIAQLWVDDSPELLAQLEEDVMRSSRLPEERRVILRRDLLATQRAHREQFDHCQHLLVLQDLRHTKSRSTHYARDPARVCRCAFFGYQSQIEDTDVDSLIKAFKTSYCVGCEKRDPYQRE
jgi:hypothetical protein